MRMNRPRLMREYALRGKVPAGFASRPRKAVEISSRKGAEKAATKAAASEGTEDARDQRLG